jgi:hypothetical protein
MMEKAIQEPGIDMASVPKWDQSYNPPSPMAADGIVTFTEPLGNLGVRWLISYL